MESWFSFWFPPAKIDDGLGRATKNPFAAPAAWQKRRKDENLPRYHSSLPPQGGHTHRDTIISPPCNGSARPRLLLFSAAAGAASSAGLGALCLAPPGTSLKVHSRLLLCVIALIVFDDNRPAPNCQAPDLSPPEPGNPGSGGRAFLRWRTAPGGGICPAFSSAPGPRCPRPAPPPRPGS